MFWLLRREGVGASEEVARSVSGTFVQHPHWQVSADQERDVRRDMYRAMGKAIVALGVERVSEIVDRVLAMLRKASS